MEDYSANRKGPQQGGGTVGFSFGAAGVQQTQASGFGTFGQPNKPAAATFGGKTIVILLFFTNAESLMTVVFMRE